MHLSGCVEEARSIQETSNKLLTTEESTSRGKRKLEETTQPSGEHWRFGFNPDVDNALLRLKCFQHFFVFDVGVNSLRIGRLGANLRCTGAVQTQEEPLLHLPQKSGTHWYGTKYISHYCLGAYVDLKLCWYYRLCQTKSVLVSVRLQLPMRSLILQRSQILGHSQL